MGTALGLDLAIRTGSLVQIRVDPNTNAIENYRVLRSWTKGPSTKMSAIDIIEWFKANVFCYITRSYDTKMAVDWDSREIYWGANKTQVSLKTFIAGYLKAHCDKHGVECNFIVPQHVRTFFGFTNQKTKKEEVQKHFLTRVPRICDSERVEAYKSMTNGTEHDLDAIILAYIQELKWRGEPCPLYCLHNKNLW